MQEQGFEDGVRKKMEELTITPSAPVWTAVEAQIRKKKDRRRLLFWLFPILVAGGFGIFKYAWTNKEGLVQTSTPKMAVKPNDLPTTKEQALEKPHDKRENNREAAIAFEFDNSSRQTFLTYDTNVTRPSKKKASEQHNNIKNKSKYFLSTGIMIKKAYEKPGIIESNKESLLASTALDEAASSYPSSSSSTDTAGIEVAVNVVNDTAPTDSIVAKPKPSSTPSKKWNWSIQANVGVSNLKQTLLGENAPNFMSSPLNTTPQAPQSNTASTIRRGAAFSIGATADRDLTKRIKLMAGIQYTYFSTRIGVGQKIARDTSIATGGFANTRQEINGYYTPGSSKNYTNSYHFIQVPVGIEWKVLKSAPLVLHAGVSISQLLATNHLERSANGTIYYKSSDKLTKTGVNLFGGINYRIWQGSKGAFHIGPYLQYGLSPLRKTSNQRLVFTGLQTIFSF